MPRYRTLSAVAAALLAAAGVTCAAMEKQQENDALAVAKAPVTLIQAVTKAEQQLNGKASRAEFEHGKKGPHYEVEVVAGAKVFDVLVDAGSGAILSSVEDKGDRDGDRD